MIMKIVAALVSVVLVLWGRNILLPIITKNVKVFNILAILIAGVNILAIFCNFSPWLWFIPLIVLGILQFNLEQEESLKATRVIGLAFAVSLLAALVRVQDQKNHYGGWTILIIIIIPILFELVIIALGRMKKL